MLLCFGSPLIDIIASVENDFLEKFELKPDDAIRSQSFHHSIFKEILLLEHKVLLGGSVTNTARVFQWISNKSSSVFYVGTVGCDEFGDLFKQKLKEEGIRGFLFKNNNRETGKCAVLVSGREKHRSLVTDLGASKEFDVRYLEDSDLKDTIKNCKFLYISTFFLGVSINVVRQLIDSFKKQNKDKKVIVNLAACFLCETYPEEVKYMFQNADLVVGNKKEFLSFAQISGTNNSAKSIEKALETLDNLYNNNQKTARLLLITNGPDPVITYQNGKINHFKVEPVKNIVDTNGAGDAFLGGFLAKFVESCPLEDCVKCGLWCANRILQCIGCEFDNTSLYTE